MSDLSIDEIPEPDADYEVIAEFALTYNAYEQMGGFAYVAQLANEASHTWRATGSLPKHLDALRACLFFEQRRHRHFGDPPEGEALDYVQALLSAMRDTLKPER